MTLDGLTLNFIVREMESIIGCRVDKVFQPQPDTILLALRPSGNTGEHARLLLSAGAADSRMYLTSRKYTNPKAPPMFCMFLRKYITGARITGIVQFELERIVDVFLETKDELGIVRELILTIELMGKYSNIILKDEKGVIMDSLRHVTPAQSRVRSVLPSLAYKRPQSSKLNPAAASEEEITELLRGGAGGNMKAYLSASLQGVSSQAAEEILYGISREDSLEAIARRVYSFFSSKPHPVLYIGPDGAPFFYSPFLFSSISAAKYESTDGVNALADEYYGRLYEKRLFDSKRDALKKIVSKQLDKQYTRLNKLQYALEETKKADVYKNGGDIITANIYRIAKGSPVLFAEDFVTGGHVEIKLNPRLSPSANAQAYYKKYSKLRSGIDITTKRISEAREETDFLESVQVSLDLCEIPEELSEIETELSRNGVISGKPDKKSEAQKPSQPYKFISTDGYTFYAGKNNRQNDLLTMKTASHEDIWLHTKNIPGSHVIITVSKEQIPDSTLFEAATIAATLSKAKSSSKVSVDYTARKNVRKPSGAKPGMVVYENYSTIVVDPDTGLLKRLISC